MDSQRTRSRSMMRRQSKAIRLCSTEKSQSQCLTSVNKVSSVDQYLPPILWCRNEMSCGLFQCWNGKRQTGPDIRRRIISSISEILAIPAFWRIYLKKIEIDFKSFTLSLLTSVSKLCRVNGPRKKEAPRNRCEWWVKSRMNNVIFVVENAHHWWHEESAKQSTGR